MSASSGTPAGTVTFYSCTTNTCSTKTSLGTGTLNSSGKATLATSSLPVGTTYVEAVYGASGNYSTSTSNVVSQVVNALGTTSSLTSAPNPSTFASSVTFTDTVSASSGTPAGTVTFYSCTTNTCSTKTSLGTGTLNSSGKATLATSSLPVGTTYVEAVYGASGNYSTSTSNVVSQVVNALSTTSSLTSAPNPSTFGLLGHLHRHRECLLGHAGGHGHLLQLHHQDLSTKTSLGTGTLDSSGKATLATSSLPVGTAYVEAVYGASGNYSTSTSNVVSQVVNALSTTSSLTSAPNPSTFGLLVTFTDTVSASSGTPAARSPSTAAPPTPVDEDLARHRDPRQLGQGHLGHLEPAGGHRLRRGRLRGLGQLLDLDVERGEPGRQHALDHLEPHLGAQPLDLRPPRSPSPTP